MFRFSRQLAKKILRYPFSFFILGDYHKFKKAGGSERFKLSAWDFYPQIKDKTITTGFDRHYVYHTSWAARVVKEINPTFHTDISSSLYFCGLVSAFIPVHFYDYRPADLHLSDLETHKGDLHDLPFADNSVNSLSCLHTIEHIGLGRYGDPIDPEGDIKAINELKRVLAPGGSLLIVTPVGKPRIEFNAHRIYSYEQIVSYFTDENISLKEFTFIPELDSEGGMIRNADPRLVQKSRYACGCFWFVKK